MPRYKEIKDLYFTEEGDFFYDTDRGEFADTANDQYRGLIQKIQTRLSSTQGDWALQAGLGANMGDFVGKRNTREIGEKIKSRIYSELVNVLPQRDLIVDVIPITTKRLAIVLSITPGDVKKKLSLTYTYDMRDNKLVPRNI